MLLLCKYTFAISMSGSNADLSMLGKSKVSIAIGDTKVELNKDINISDETPYTK